MFRVNTNVDSIKKIDKHIELVNKMKNMKTDTDFQKFIKNKCWETLNNVINNKLKSGLTTNDDSISLYINSNHIEDLEDGFIIYNDAKVPANVFGNQNIAENYPNGEFSIALAFEYGVGIVGEKTNNENAWDYNVRNYNFGWYLPKNVLGQSGIRYVGYEGFEIYRFTANEIETQLPKWVNDYYRRVTNG